MTGHIHLDPVGGLSGDMFIAAMLSLAPELEAKMQADLAAAGLTEHITLTPAPGRKGAFAALRLVVRQHPAAPPTSDWRAIRAFLETGGLAEAVKVRAIAIFSLLAEAEAACHDVPVDAVHFHEIADWDSVADIVAAASLIERSGAGSWSVSALPVGGGRIETRHGLIPLPAPATARLLRGFAFFDDGVEGERVTPTGAAILRHLEPARQTAPAGAALDAIGVGAGSRDLPGVANICRALRFESAVAAPEMAAEIAFEIDDMTPEEIAVALDRIRAAPGALDAGYTLGYGKKGRPRYAVAVLARAEAAEAVADLCFDETSTLGLRLASVARRVLSRRSYLADGLRAKRARRPSGATAKAESDDLAATEGLKARRERAAAAEALDE